MNEKTIAVIALSNRDFPSFGEKLTEAVKWFDLASLQGADLVVEAVGGYTGDTAGQAIQLCRRLGRIVILGAFHRPFETNFGTLLSGEKALLFANCYSIRDERHDFDVALDILSSGRLPLRELVTHTFPLDEAREALETAYDKSTHCIKVQLVP